MVWSSSEASTASSSSGTGAAGGSRAPSGTTSGRTTRFLRSCFPRPRREGTPQDNGGCRSPPIAQTCRVLARSPRLNERPHPLDRLEFAVIGLGEGAEVDSDGGLGAQSLLRANGFLGIDVGLRHEPA